MSTYVIGDIQGCIETLHALLKKIAFDPASDRLLLVGDLVNRGPSSLEVLRWVRDHHERVACVLGNHDLHLLARANGKRDPSPDDTLDPILEASDRDELLAWLIQKPFLLNEKESLVVHAGLDASWTGAVAARLAAELSEAIHEVLDAINTPPAQRWDDNLEGPERWSTLAGIFTRLRACHESDGFLWDFSGPLDALPKGALPWFRCSPKACTEHTIYCGHWAALGEHKEGRVHALDSGCVWGGQLTACRLEDGATVSHPLVDSPRPL